MRTVPPPPDSLRLSLPRGAALLAHRRSVGVCLVLLVLVLAIGTASLLTGTYSLGGAGSELDRFIVVDQRLPRVLAAVLVGAMLALSGAVFQSVSRNPLGSPDIVGFTTGASTGGLLVILLGVSTTSSVALGTTLGGALTAAVVVLIALRRRAGGDGLVLVGVALAQMLGSFNDYLLSRATIESAEAAKAWQYGSLNAVSWPQVRPLALGAALLLPLVVGLVRPTRVLEMGDDTATGLGLRPYRWRGVLVGYGVVLAALCVAVSGPIGFVALAAPQVARRLCRSAGTTLTASAVTGAFLLALADLVAARLLAPFQIPVGLVSSACGGLYLMWLVGLRKR